MTNSITFVPSLTEVNKDTDVIAADVVTMGTAGIMYFVNEAIDNGTKGEVFIVDGNMELASNIAAVMNSQYQEEMKLMKDANIEAVKQEVERFVSTTMEQPEEEKNVVVVGGEKAALRSNADAKKFLKEQAAKLASAKQSPNKGKEKAPKTEEETTMTNTKVKATGRRRISSTNITTTEEEVTMTNTNVETKGNAMEEKAPKANKAPKGNTAPKKEEKAATGRRRVSSGSESPAPKMKERGAGKMGRTAPQTGSSFVKFEGPWYMNASRYEVLNRLPEIVGSYSDAELGIEEITFSNPEDIARYKYRNDILFVIQMKSNGAILDFPIKAATGKSASDVSSPSIGWVEYNGKLNPVFGFSRPNAMEVEFVCGCGAKNKANTGNMYCRSCKKTWADMDVAIADYGFEYKKEDWVFQQIPNLKVPTEVLVLALALAQYDEGLDMYGLIDEEA